MSQAHRPTWNPTQGRETKAGSQQVSKLSLASHTKLKFRQPGQTNSGDVARRDLKAELAIAERNALDKKRKAQGLPPLPPIEGALRITATAANGDGQVDEEAAAAAKRRKVLEEAAEMDKDDESDDENAGGHKDKGKGKAAANDDDDDDDEEDDDDDDDDSDDEDDTAALMAELAKIKQERAEEKARLEAESSASAAQDRESEIATGNPLLNLQAALGQGHGGAAPSTPGSTTSGVSSSFAVKRRWDDDLIFKNQAAGLDEKGKKGEFVNDLLRSEFHKKFMLKFIK
ncbi:hypothetical protein IAT40_003509 [Kwoniella sp. CBS 6097]